MFYVLLVIAILLFIIAFNVVPGFAKAYARVVACAYWVCVIALIPASFFAIRWLVTTQNGHYTLMFTSPIWIAMVGGLLGVIGTIVGTKLKSRKVRTEYFAKTEHRKKLAQKLVQERIGKYYPHAEAEALAVYENEVVTLLERGDSIPQITAWLDSEVQWDVETVSMSPDEFLTLAGAQ